MQVPNKPHSHIYRTINMGINAVYLPPDFFDFFFFPKCVF